MTATPEETLGAPPHRTFSELMDLSSGIFCKGDYRLIAKQAEAHRAAAEASDLPAVRAHRTALADNLDGLLAAHREKAAPEN